MTRSRWRLTGSGTLSKGRPKTRAKKAPLPVVRDVALRVDRRSVRAYVRHVEQLMESANRPRACGYVRVSSRRQRDEGNSLSDQREAILRFCVLEGLELTEIYSDGAISGGRDETRRAGLASVIDAVREGRAQTVVVKHIDRLSRDSDLAGYLKIELKKHGGTLVVIDEAKNDPIRRVVDKMLAELEKLRGSERMRFAHAAKKQRGLWTGMVPFGFRLGEDGKLTQADAEMPGDDSSSR